jgi:hypothetical protein
MVPAHEHTVMEYGVVCKLVRLCLKSVAQQVPAP